MSETEGFPEQRSFLKDTVRKQVDFRRTAQARGLPPPPMQKPCPPDAARIPLVPPERFSGIRRVSLTDAIRGRESRRRYTDAPLSLEEPQLEGLLGPAVDLERLALGL